MKHRFTILTIAAILLIATWAVASEEVSSEINENIVRLHILANSNGEYDQSLKLKVRDRLLAEVQKAKNTLTDKQIESICQDEVKKQGYHYAVSVKRGRFYFPKKQYENITLPAGNYNAVRVIIGSGVGENWWCVMYPPLCFGAEGKAIDDEAMQKLKSSMSPEAFSVICESNQISIKPSFKLVELWQQLKAKIA